MGPPCLRDDDTGIIQVYRYSLGKWSTFGQEVIGTSNDERLASDIALSRDGTVKAVSGYSLVQTFSTTGVVHVF